MSACLRNVPGRVPYRVKRELGWRSPGPIYITLRVGESKSSSREREREIEEGKSDRREPQQKQQRGARDGYLANLVTEKGEVRDA